MTKRQQTALFNKLTAEIDRIEALHSATGLKRCYQPWPTRYHEQLMVAERALRNARMHVMSNKT